MSRVAIASSTQLSADAGATIAREGGNAVDAAIAASLVAISTEPGICSPGCGGFITIWPAAGDPVTFDGNIEMPGRNLAPERLGGGAWEVNMEYGGGISTYVGHGSVGTPGGLAAYDRAWSDYGKIPWRELFGPAIKSTKEGFPLSPASHNYLRHAHDCVYGWLSESHAPLHHGSTLKNVGDLIKVEHLSESLDAIAQQGVDSFYRGDLAKLIATDFETNEGVMTATDLAEYEVIKRKPLAFSQSGWTLATNPAPAVGGVSLVAMLELLSHPDHAQVAQSDAAGWSQQTTVLIADIQHRVLMHRLHHLDYSHSLDEDTQALLELARTGSVPLSKPSASTVHTSAVDSNGLACAITMSSGYGAGVMPPGTGIWMNNCLGEIELNRKGLNAGPPGMRLASNMAPTTGRHVDGRVLAIGSPGADRITSALLCTLNNFMRDELPLDEAIARPRLHLEINDGDPRVAYERGLDVTGVLLPVREFAEPSMFFGGVGATLFTPGNELVAAADPRRSGGHCVV
ncbi:MAG: gamma-glutamyltransferase [Gammaproteobacteria bacterium]